MAVIYNQCIMNWIDKNGKTCESFWTTQDQTAGGAGVYDALATAAEGISDARIQAIQFQTTLFRSVTPADGPYCTVLDRAYFKGRLDGVPAPFTVAVPGPKAGIFLVGNEIVDLSNTDVIAFQTQCQALLGSSTGVPWGPFQRGYRTEAKGIS